MSGSGSSFSIFIRIELDQNFRFIFRVGTSSDLVNGSNFFIESGPTHKHPYMQQNHPFSHQQELVQ